MSPFDRGFQIPEGTTVFAMAIGKDMFAVRVRDPNDRNVTYLVCTGKLTTSGEIADLVSTGELIDAKEVRKRRKSHVN